MKQWTKQQNDAINARNRNILISAAAGSGKTAVLVERVIKLITDKNNPVDVDKLLVVTFTKAAASEMKARIGSSLREIIKNEPNNFNALRQISLLPAAKICTIDSFCLNFVKENFFQLGLSQDFTNLDNSEEAVLSETALNDVLNQFFEENDDDFIALVEHFSSSKNDRDLISVIKKIYDYIYSQPFPIKWLSDMIELYNPSVKLEESVWYPILTDEIKDGLFSGKRIISDCFNLLDNDDLLYEKYKNMLNSDLDLYDYLIKSLDSEWDEIINSFKKIKFVNMPWEKNYTSPIKEELTAKRKIYKDKIIPSIRKLFCSSAEDYTTDLSVIYPVLKKLCEVVSKFNDEYFLLKSEKNKYSFNDVLHFAINLLGVQNEKGDVIRTKLAENLQENYYEILVDEYQDTNESQDMLFKLLSNGNNRFMVGDVKQSIYRFRIAMPFIFTSKKNNYEEYKEENEYVSSKIILDKNFRSKKDICEYVNYVFSEFMTEKVGELNYDESEYLNYGADYSNYETASAQIKILENDDSAVNDRNEAIYIARTIQKKICSGELVKENNNEYRPIKYSDFAILLRSAKSHISDYNDVLTSFGIPVICDKTESLFECSEIKIILSLLRVIDNPMQDIPLLAVMMSPLYGFTADEMAEIKVQQENKKLNLYTSVINSDSKHVKSFLKEIELFGKMVITMPVSSFIRYLCDYKSIYAFVNALGNSQQRAKNIEKFIELASSFDKSDSVGLTSFMRFIDKLLAGDNGVETAKINTSFEDAVNIMSIHRSKGLEFPVVILAGTSTGYNTNDLYSKLLLNPAKGLGVKLHDSELLYNCNTIPYVAIQSLNKNAMMSENLRVLYVAMTRAKEQFISFITVNSTEKAVKNLAAKIIDGKVDEYFCKNITSDSDFILLSALMHQNGKELRKLANIDVKTVAANFPLDIEIITSVDDIEPHEESKKALPDEELLNVIRERISYKYENDNLSYISAKRTASSLDESIKNLDFFASSKPAFLSEDGMTPGEKGTAMHTFMQFCNYDNAKNNLDSEIERLFISGFINEKQKDCLDKAALSKLFKSDFAERLFNSSKIYREIKVSSFVSANEIENTNSDEKVLIQGISDCVFEENGKLILVDYKTDKVKNEVQLLEMYKNQIAFYVKAVSKTLQKEVKEAVLYSFSLGKPCYYELF